MTLKSGILKVREKTKDKETTLKERKTNDTRIKGSIGLVSISQMKFWDQTIKVIDQKNLNKRYPTEKRTLTQCKKTKSIKFIKT